MMQRLAAVNVGSVPQVFLPASSLEGLTLYCTWPDGIYKSSWYHDGVSMQCWWSKVTDDSVLEAVDGHLLSPLGDVVPKVAGPPAAAAAAAAAAVVPKLPPRVPKKAAGVAKAVPAAVKKAAAPPAVVNKAGRLPVKGAGKGVRGKIGK